MTVEIDIVKLREKLLEGTWNHGPNKVRALDELDDAVKAATRNEPPTPPANAVRDPQKRIAELLAANNAEVERRRAAEARCATLARALGEAIETVKARLDDLERLADTGDEVADRLADSYGEKLARWETASQDTPAPSAAAPAGAKPDPSAEAPPQESKEA